MTILYRDFERNRKTDNGLDFPQPFYDHVVGKVADLFNARNGITNTFGDTKDDEKLWQDSKVATFKSVLDLGADYVGLAFDGSLATTNEYVGYVICASNRVVELYVDPKYRRQCIATDLITEFKKLRKNDHQQFIATWFNDCPELVRLAVGAGFDVTTSYTEFTPSGIESVATTPISMEYHNNIVDGAEKSYVEFRGNYAVVDGHYTLKELESILVLARKELTDAE